nr:MAG TPA: hypothetical protein [Caudoviricetes sp.]
MPAKFPHLSALAYLFDGLRAHAMQLNTLNCATNCQDNLPRQVIRQEYMYDPFHPAVAPLLAEEVERALQEKADREVNPTRLVLLSFCLALLDNSNKKLYQKPITELFQVAKKYGLMNAQTLSAHLQPAAERLNPAVHQDIVSLALKLSDSITSNTRR